MVAGRWKRVLGIPLGLMALQAALAQQSEGKRLLSAEDIVRGHAVQLATGSAVARSGESRVIAVEPVKTYITFQYHSVGPADLFADRQLDELARAYHMPQMRDVKIVVDGHTDSDAPEDYNGLLPMARAQRIVIELAKRGVPIERIETVGRGESEPEISPERTEWDKELNRRVVFRAW